MSRVLGGLLLLLTLVGCEREAIVQEKEHIAAQDPTPTPTATPVPTPGLAAIRGRWRMSNGW